MKKLGRASILDVLQRAISVFVADPAPCFNSEAGSARYAPHEVVQALSARSFRTPWMRRPRDEVTLVYYRPRRKVL